MASAAQFTERDQQEAQRIWTEYQRTNDLSARKGQIAAIDPATGDVWFGAWITDIVAERSARGLTSPLWFERVGSPTCVRKGGRSGVVFGRQSDANRKVAAEL